MSTTVPDFRPNDPVRLIDVPDVLARVVEVYEDVNGYSYNISWWVKGSHYNLRVMSCSIEKDNEEWMG